MEWFSDELVELFKDFFWVCILYTWVVSWSELRYWDKSFDSVKIDQKTSLVGFIWNYSYDFFGIKI